MTAWMTAADEAALAQFEAIVLSQKPAETPWEPVTDYSWEAREPIERPHAQRIIAAFSPATVLDVGCGPGHLLRLLAEYRGTNRGLYGFDKEADDSGPYSQVDIAERVEYPDCDAPGLSWWFWNDWQRTFDLVICREVLEHLTIRQAGQAIRNLCTFSKRFLYITTRFARNASSLLSVDTSDDLDPTHITMLNQTFLRALIVLEGFKRRADLEEQMDWQKKGRCLVYERA